MEECVLRARGVLEDREDRRHGSSDVCSVQRHCHVYRFLRTYVAVAAVGEGGAFWGVVEFGGFLELMNDGAWFGVIGRR